MVKRMRTVDVGFFRKISLTPSTVHTSNETVFSRARRKGKLIESIRKRNLKVLDNLLGRKG